MADNEATRYCDSPESMSLITFSFPTPTLFGVGAVAELPARSKRLGIRRPLVVTDPGLLKTDAFDTLTKTLGERGQGKDWFVYAGVHPNPVEQDVREAAAAFREHNCDGIIAVGGGSPLDAGKAARLLVKRSNLDFTKFYDEPDWSG